MSDLKNRAARPTQSDVRHIWEERYHRENRRPM
ncbi:uncharacterized protein METZ01_LOCUS148531, partial [marine metagenome]